MDEEKVIYYIEELIDNEYLKRLKTTQFVGYHYKTDAFLKAGGYEQQYYDNLQKQQEIEEDRKNEQKKRKFNILHSKIGSYTSIVSMFYMLLDLVFIKTGLYKIIIDCFK